MPGRALQDALGQGFASRRPDLEACAGKAEAVQQAGGGKTGAEHRLVIGQITLNAAPGADGLGAGEGRIEFGGVSQDVEDGQLAGAGAVGVEGEAAPAAQPFSLNSRLL